jgi:hypothetical protein
LKNLRYFRDKYATREYLAAKAKEVKGFRYALFMCGPFTEFAGSEFFGIDTKRHVIEAYR